MPANQDAQMLAVYNDELFVFVKNKGLVKYHLVFSNLNYSLIEDNTFTLANGSPTYMAADTFGLYVSYRLKGLFAFDRQTLSQTGYYRTGLDYRKYTDQYGVRDLFCKNNLIFLVEYQCQTSLLTMDSALTALNDYTNSGNNILIYPNPASDNISVMLPSTTVPQNAQIKIYSIQGGLVRYFPVTEKVTQVDIKGMKKGIYILSIISDDKPVKSSKFIKE
jgi:hypothetical protein